MIKVEDLSKTYRIKNKAVTKALDNISFSLDNSGLVFVVGKSGSGKSTLLNMLGALDSFDRGEISIGDKKFSQMSINEFQEYRAQYLGFVFQECHLIDSLTVYENVKIALDIIDNSNVQAIDETLSKLSIIDLRNRYPSELSAGQKQRVAIARAIVKKPKIILCDEPTGNLDSKTSVQILEELKKISKDILVLVVSHNLDDAYLYGDRIIEISDGKITKDVVNKNENKRFVASGGNLYLSNVSSFSNGDIQSLNETIQNGNIQRIYPYSELLNNFDNSDIETTSKYQVEKKKYPFKKSIKLANRFIKSDVASMIVTSFLGALIVSIFGVCQMFAKFKTDDVVKQTLNNSGDASLVLKKGIYASDEETVIETYLNSISDEDITAIDESGYQGNCYKLYSYNLPLSFSHWYVPNEYDIYDINNIVAKYAGETYGTLVCDLDFIKANLKLDKIDLLAGTINEEDPLYKKEGLIITDYIADSILFYKNADLSEEYKLDYDDIIGVHSNTSNITPTDYGYINAIIKTNYESRYPEMMEFYNTIADENNALTAKEIKEFIKSETCMQFVDDVRNSLGITYSINPNFYNDMQSSTYRNFARLNYSKFSIVGFEDFSYSISSNYAFLDSKLGYDFDDYTLGISLVALNKILESQSFYTGGLLTFDEAEQYVANINTGLLKIDKYACSDYMTLNGSIPGDSDITPRYSHIIKLKVFDNPYYSFLADEKLFNDLRKNEIINYAVFLDDMNTASLAYSALSNRPFATTNSYVEGVKEVGDAVSIFNDFYFLLAMALSFASLVTLSTHAVHRVRKRKKEIGILKALGAKNADVGKIFIYQIGIAGIMTSILYTIALFIMINVSNKVLSSSFANAMGNAAFYSINTISFNPLVFVIDIILIIAITILSAIIPLLLMRKIEPINIIKARE